MKVKIRLDTLTDVQNLVKQASTISRPVYITDGKGLKVSAKSIMGALYSLEFEELWCECEQDIFHIVKDFIAE